jgi:hypothetical protein
MNSTRGIFVISLGNGGIFVIFPKTDSRAFYKNLSTKLEKFNLHPKDSSMSEDAFDSPEESMDTRS